MGVPALLVLNTGSGCASNQSANALRSSWATVLSGKSAGKGEKLKDQPLPADFPSNTVAHEDLGAFADWLLAQPEPVFKTNKAGTPT